MDNSGLSGPDLVAAIKQAGVTFFLAVPDITTSEGLLWPVSQDPELRLIRVCKEDETFGICAGLSYSNHRAVLSFQHTGLLDSINALRAVAVEYSLPICMIVGLLNKEPNVRPSESKSYGVRIVEPVLDAMGVRHELIETNADIAKVKPAIERCYDRSEPVVLLIGRTVAWPRAKGGRS